MKISELWLREWVNPAVSTQALAARLTMTGLEVEGIYPVAGHFEQVVVAEVVHTSPHPSADKLTLCKVDAGDMTCGVVCGASNVRTGLKVAFARLGACLPGGLTIKEVTLRGELSQGMLCSASELGLEEHSQGILELPDDAPVGSDLCDYMGLKDEVLDLNITPNRGDCFSVLGIAREVSASNQVSLTPPVFEMVTPKTDLARRVILHAPEACPRYVGRVIHAINPAAKTPLWMQERLRRSGVRLIHPVVDVTHYVMLELGQPMHAFDLAAVQGDIQVRFAHEQEELTVLDGQTLQLSKDVLVIADDHKPLAMAGIMGTENSAVSENTVDVFLESAFFNPLTISGVARRYGLNSDASQRFERGVDPQLQDQALERATELLIAIAGGEAGPRTSAVESEYLPSDTSIVFNPKQVEQLCGVEIPVLEIESILQRLNMRVSRDKSIWQVQVPSYRFDVFKGVDLVEEIIRIYGYEKIVRQTMKTPVKAGKITSNERLTDQIGDFLMHRGYHETISYSFVDPALQEALYPDDTALTLLNPISQELSQMRVGLWPGLLASMIYNLHRQQTAVKLFETGVVFECRDGSLSESAHLAGLLTGEVGRLNWSESTRQFDFYDIKGDLQALCAALNTEAFSFAAFEHTALHPGQSAAVYQDEQQIGWIGALHPRILEALDLEQDVFVFELSLQAFLERKPSRYEEVSKFPQIRRDLSFLIKKAISSDQVIHTIKQAVSTNWLKSVDVFDVYMGDGIPRGQKSLGVALILQDNSRTLKDSEINVLIDAIIKQLQDDFDITLRD